MAAACVVALLGAAHATAAQTPPPKIIIDSDFGTLNDDGQLLAIAAQLQARGQLEILGLTIVSGNQWLRQEAADALKAVERLGIEQQVGVYAGANYALSHDLAAIRREQELGAGGDGYLGAWNKPEPQADADLAAPPDGHATHTRVREQSAVEFIADSVRRHPGEVTILAVGPLTNIALAARRHPDIVPHIRQIIYMGGAFDVGGNSTRAAEFNWWFDPEAAREVLRLPVRHVVFPLDVTNTVRIDRRIYDRVVYGAARDGVLARLYKQLNGYGYDGRNGFETNPAYRTDVWDTLTLAYLIDPSYATRSVRRWIDIDVTGGINTGRAIGHAAPRPGLRPATVVKRFDNRRFFQFYVDGLTAPVPVAPPRPRSATAAR